MSTRYEQDGRTQQKQRTRTALLDATRRLLAAGTVPTVDEAAAAASISRTTAYRYFSNQAALLVAAHPELTVPTLLSSDAPADPAARFDAAVGEFTRMTTETEPQLRAMLRLSLAPERPDPDSLALRRGRAISWLEEALEGMAGLDGAERHRLALAIRAAVGIESLVWLTDVAGLDRTDAVELQRWSARALLRAALDEPPPVPNRTSRRRRRR